MNIERRFNLQILVYENRHLLGPGQPKRTESLCDVCEPIVIPKPPKKPKPWTKRWANLFLRSIDEDWEAK